MKAQPAGVRRIGVGLAAALALLTSACAAGQIAQTANQKPTLDGTEINVGDMALRAVAIAAPSVATASYPKGSDIVLRVVMVNAGQSTDTLVSIKTSVTGAWAAYASKTEADTVLQADSGSSSSAPASSAPASSAPASSTAASSAPASSTAASSAAASSTSAGSSTAPASSAPASSGPASSSPASAPLPQGTQSVTIRAGEAASFGTPNAMGALLLLKTTRTLFSGNSVRVTFTFARSGSVTLPVPIQLTGQAGTAAVAPPSAAPTE